MAASYAYFTSEILGFDPYRVVAILIGVFASLIYFERENNTRSAVFAIVTINFSSGFFIAPAFVSIVAKLWPWLAGMEVFIAATFLSALLGAEIFRGILNLTPALFKFIETKINSWGARK